MHDLTTDQFTNLKTLLKNTQLIEQISIDMHSNSLLRVTIISVIDADFNAVDAEIEKIFPGKSYRGSVGEEEYGDFYMIDVDGETLINLMVKKSPEEVEWTLEEIMRQEG